MISNACESKHLLHGCLSVLFSDRRSWWITPYPSPAVSRCRRGETAGSAGHSSTRASPRSPPPSASLEKRVTHISPPSMPEPHSCLLATFATCDHVIQYPFMPCHVAGERCLWSLLAAWRRARWFSLCRPACTSLATAPPLTWSPLTRTRWVTSHVEAHKRTSMAVFGPNHTSLSQDIDCAVLSMGGPCPSDARFPHGYCCVHIVAPEANSTCA